MKAKIVSLTELTETLVDMYQNELNEKDKKVSELETKIQEKDELIKKLEEEIARLKN